MADNDCLLLHLFHMAWMRSDSTRAVHANLYCPYSVQVFFRPRERSNFVSQALAGAYSHPSTLFAFCACCISAPACLSSSTRVERGCRPPWAALGLTVGGRGLSWAARRRTFSGNVPRSSGHAHPTKAIPSAIGVGSREGRVDASAVDCISTMNRELVRVGRVVSLGTGSCCSSVQWVFET